MTALRLTSMPSTVDTLAFTELNSVSLNVQCSSGWSTLIGPDHSSFSALIGAKVSSGASAQTGPHLQAIFTRLIILDTEFIRNTAMMIFMDLWGTLGQGRGSDTGTTTQGK